MSGIGRAVGLFTGASLIGALTQVIKGKITAVVLGTAGVGILNQLTNMWSLVSVFAAMGLYNGMVRHMTPGWASEDRLALRRHFSTNALVMIGVGLFLALAGSVFSAEISNILLQDDGAHAAYVSLILVSVPVYVAGMCYRAILNSAAAVGKLVRARIMADVLSVLVVAIATPWLGLQGAVIGYIALHILYFGLLALFVLRLGGANVAVPDPRLFKVGELRRNLPFGGYGLFVSALGITTSLLIAGRIIAALGVHENGLYAMGLKVTTVYLGGITAAAGGYLLPTLVRAKDDDEIRGHLDKVLSSYLYIVPPIAVVLMSGGELMMRVLFSAEFVPAAQLLLLLLPGDLFRITAETLGIVLMVKKRLAVAAFAYLCWVLAYSALALLLMPEHGVQGVAAAYALSHAFLLVVQLVLCRWSVNYTISGRTLVVLLRGLAMVATSASVIGLTEQKWLHWTICVVVLAVWTGASLRDPQFKAILLRVLRRRKEA